MRMRIPIAAALRVAGTTSAALPPQFQTAKDLDAMVAFIKQHDRVAAELKATDVKRYIVYCGDNCQAQFTRQAIERPRGWVGPAAPLVFSYSRCPLSGRISRRRHYYTVT
ncbi:MAG: hypothetical protein JSR34_04405 [Proteobacteria bacterium]|nr:hypothetical protein [Pseudomonadota bacterium]